MPRHFLEICWLHVDTFLLASLVNGVEQRNCRGLRS